MAVACFRQLALWALNFSCCPRPLLRSPSRPMLWFAFVLHTHTHTHIYIYIEWFQQDYWGWTELGKRQHWSVSLATTNLRNANIIVFCFVSTCVRVSTCVCLSPPVFVCPLVCLSPPVCVCVFIDLSCDDLLLFIIFIIIFYYYDYYYWIS